MSGILTKVCVARLASWLAAVMLLLPPLPGLACACRVQSEQHPACACCSRHDGASQDAARTCCAKHRDRHQTSCCHRPESSTAAQTQDIVHRGPVCHCQHGQPAETPVAPVNQTERSVDQLAAAQVAVVEPVFPTIPTLKSAACPDDWLAADTSLARCILLSRLTL